jgi:hypothetical protein
MTVYFSSFVVMVYELRTFCLLNKCSTTRATSQPSLVLSLKQSCTCVRVCVCVCTRAMALEFRTSSTLLLEPCPHPFYFRLFFR